MNRMHSFLPLSAAFASDTLDRIFPVGIPGDKQNFTNLPPRRHGRLFINEDHQIHGFGDQALLRALVASATRLSRRIRPLTASLACTVAAPPGCPVFHAFSRVWASAPRTSPTTIRVGFRRIQARRQSSIPTLPTARRSR